MDFRVTLDIVHGPSGDSHWIKAWMKVFLACVNALTLLDGHYIILKGNLQDH